MRPRRAVCEIRRGPLHPRRAFFEILEDRSLLAAELHQANYFATWNANPQIIPSTDPADVGYNPLTGHLFIADSEIDEIAQFAGVNVFETSLDGKTLYRSYATNNLEPTGVSFNEFDGFYYTSNDDSKFITRYSTDFSTKLLERKTTADVVGALDPEGITVNNADGALYVIDGVQGGMQVLVYNHNLQYLRSFPINGNGFLTDAEGIAYHPPSGHLFVQGGKKLAEFTIDGAFIQGWSLTTGFSPAFNAPQGAVFAPTSDPSDSPANLALYISDGGVDNFPDGGIYELTITGLAGSNSPPAVDAGADRLISAALPASTALQGSFTDDGLPVDGTVTTTWSQVSGPATASFANPALLNTSASFPASGVYVLRLTVSDGESTRTDDVSISVNIAKVERRIAVSSDDAEQSLSGSVSVNNDDLELVVDASINQTVGLRFPSLSIPRGAVITNAYVQFQADEIKTAAASLTVRGQATDNAATFVAQTLNISNRPKTSASVTWNPAAWNVVGEEGVNQRTPELKSIVQEIVNRPGWASGNAMAMILAGTGVRTARSFDGLASGAPKLVVEYVIGANTPPSINAGVDQTVTVNVAANLDGTVSDDGIGSSGLTTAWSQVTGPGAVTFGNVSSVDTTAAFSQPGIYVLALTGSDGEFSRSDQVTITVNPPPVIRTVSFQDGVFPSASYLGTSDTLIRGDALTTTSGSASTLTVDGSPDYGVLIKWNVDQIPAGSVVRAASIRLQVTNGSVEPYEIFEMKRNWSEGSASWIYYAIAKIWGSFGAQNSSDRGSTVLGSVVSAGAGVATINLNAAGLQLVQKWVNNPSSNFGFVIQDYARSSDELSFGSSEQGTLANRPMFSVTYDSPSPLAVLAMMGSTPSSLQPVAASTGTQNETSAPATIPISRTIPAGGAPATSGTAMLSAYDAIYRALGRQSRLIRSTR